MEAAGDLSYEHTTRRSTDAAALACSLFEQHQRRVSRHCAYILHSRQDAEDAVQQTFTNVLQALQKGVRPRDEAAWLLHIARNVCLERQRNAGRRARLETATSPDSLDQVAARENPADDRAADIRAALAHLDPRQREALLMREWRGLSYKEISSSLQLSQSAVEALLFRARRSLARALEDSRRLRQGFDTAGLLANLRAFLTTGAGKTIAVVGCCAATVAGTPALEHAVGHDRNAGAGISGTRPTTNVSGTPATTSGVRGGARTFATGRPAGDPGRVGLARDLGTHAQPGRGVTIIAAGPVAAADGPTATGPVESEPAPQGTRPQPPGAPNAPATTAPAVGDRPVAHVDASSSGDATTVNVGVGGSEADISVTASGPGAGAAATVNGPGGTSADAGAGISPAGAAASAGAAAPGGTDAGVAVSSDSSAAVTLGLPAAGISTTITIP